MKLLRYAAATCIAFGALTMFVTPEEAQARPQYLKAFNAKYPALVDQAKTEKCGVCHYGKSKKNKDDYGKAMGSGLTKKNQKDKAEIEAALTAAESMPSSVSGKSFGDLIADGKLPGTDPEE
ncbi:hypothetical protein [Calycomorphotria hydatis]|uniref:Cytochrome c domain-containing protein n=1 Tax=Calycomorphotria hydatis TaxID=2528027 RepID=A0A517TEY3_9PLAN|nr:hypothetical protein [Calycomorphotria hydatis]QDT66928.1 hypothetical protein V22_42000 [Calycomorphotria hydatis]